MGLDGMASEIKFKVGDRVRQLVDIGTGEVLPQYQKGARGTVVTADDSLYNFLVKFDGNPSELLSPRNEDELELVEV